MPGDFAFQFDVRTATAEDAEAVSALLAASYPVLMGEAYDEAVLREALPMMTRANPALLKSGTFYLAQAGDGRVIGCGGWSVERPGTGSVEAGVGHIRHFGVHPDFGGNGVGRALMDTCLRNARAKGISQFECYSSLNAEAFYAALGFRSVEPIEIMLGGKVPCPSIAMVREI